MSRHYWHVMVTNCVSSCHICHTCALLINHIYQGCLMDSKVKNETSIDLVSMVNSHDKPFVVIDKNYQILAVNKAYELEYGTTSDTAVGRK